MEHGKISSGCFRNHTCEIRLKLPSLNEYINDCRANKFKGSQKKKEVEAAIGLYICRLPKFQKPVRIHFHWIEKDRRRDADNIAFGKKFILDALVKRGKLIDDSRKYVVGFTDTFEQGRETKVVIEIEEINESESV